MGSLDSLRTCGMMVSFGNASGPVAPFDPLLLSQKVDLHHAADADALHDQTRRPRSARRRTLCHGQFGQVEDRGEPDLCAEGRAQAHRDLESRRTTRQYHPVAEGLILGGKLRSGCSRCATCSRRRADRARGHARLCRCLPVRRAGAAQYPVDQHRQRQRRLLRLRQTLCGDPRKSGVRLEVKTSAGSVENLERLQRAMSMSPSCRGHPAGRGGRRRQVTTARHSSRWAACTTSRCGCSTAEP